jgi:hypothetical protein
MEWWIFMENNHAEGGGMREIKFRAWSPKMQKMLSWDIVKNMMAELLLTESGANIPLQFTGLKDTNGKEIYEGDIIRDTTDIFDEGSKVCFGFYDLYTDYDSFYGLGFYLENIKGEQKFAESINEYYGEDHEIIGNIYETPELLK